MVRRNWDKVRRERPLQRDFDRTVVLGSKERTEPAPKKYAPGQFTAVLAKTASPCYVCDQTMLEGEEVLVLHIKGGPRLHTGCRIHILRSGEANRRTTRRRRRTRGKHS